jgi:hypothetical protein
MFAIALSARSLRCVNRRREEFRLALLQRIAKALTIHTPTLSEKSAADIALVILLSVKTVATHQAFFDSASSAPDEFRDMTRLYLRGRLAPSISRNIPSKKASHHDGECVSASVGVTAR